MRTRVLVTAQFGRNAAAPLSPMGGPSSPPLSPASAGAASMFNSASVGQSSCARISDAALRYGQTLRLWVRSPYLERAFSAERYAGTTDPAALLVLMLTFQWVWWITSCSYSGQHVLVRSCDSMHVCVSSYSLKLSCTDKFDTYCACSACPFHKCAAARAGIAAAPLIWTSSPQTASSPPTPSTAGTHFENDGALLGGAQHLKCAGTTHTFDAQHVCI
jgi:hypothetical protein